MIKLLKILKEISPDYKVLINNYEDDRIKVSLFYKDLCVTTCISKTIERAVELLTDYKTISTLFIHKEFPSSIYEEYIKTKEVIPSLTINVEENWYSEQKDNLEILPLTVKAIINEEQFEYKCGSKYTLIDALLQAKSLQEGQNFLNKVTN